MENQEEPARGINDPRVVSIPGSELDVETKALRRHILATLKSPFRVDDSLALTIQRLAEIEKWET